MELRCFVAFPLFNECFSELFIVLAFVAAGGFLDVPMDILREVVVGTVRSLVSNIYTLTAQERNERLVGGSVVNDHAESLH